MKRLQKATAVLLAVIMLMQNGVPAFAELGDSYALPKGDGVSCVQNADGTVTVTVRPSAKAHSKAQEAEPGLLIDQGEYYASTGANAEIELTKTYTEGEVLASVESDGAGIFFYPEPAAAEISEEAEIEAGPDTEETVQEANPLPDVTISDEEVLPEAEAVAPELAEAIKPELELFSSGAAISEEAAPDEAAQPEETLETSAEESAETVLEEDMLPVETEPDDTPVETVEIYDSVDGIVAGGNKSVLYPGAINEYTDIELAVVDGGVKENIILRRYTAPEISYVMDFQGLTPVQSGNAVALYSADGVQVGEISAPYLLDAAGAYCDSIQVSLTQQDGSYRLSYTMDEAWLQAAAYPVVLDPSVTFNVPGSNWNYIEDNYVTVSQPYTYHDFNLAEMQCNSDNIVYIRPVIMDDIKNLSGNLIVKSMTLNTYVTSVSYGGTFYAYPVTGGEWSSRSLTYANAPAYGAAVDSKYISYMGWVNWDITEAASSWFNSLDQKGNFGIAITGNGNIRLHSSDDWDNLVSYSITYYRDPSSPSASVTPYGNAINSGTGYLDLRWNAIDGAEGYYVGIHNGKEYEYFYVGNVTSWSTKGKGIWPTDSEINAGRYRLHHDGRGAELPMLPALSYNNSGGALAGNLNYTVRVIPANRYGQAPDPARFSALSARLPDTVPPSAASSVTVSPSGYSSGSNITVSWAGITDYNNSSAYAVSSMGSSGHIQYSIDNASWVNTSSATGSGSFAIDTSALADGKHYVYIRGVDSAGNYGTGKYAEFYIDRIPPTAPTVGIVPGDWSKESSVAIAWSGIADINPLSRVEYSIDGGAYSSTGHSETTYSGYSISTANLADGEHSLSVRAVDIVGNTGSAAEVRFFKDTAAPTFVETSISPDGWTNGDSAEFSWSGLADAHSGLKQAQYRIDGGQPQALPVDGEHSTQLDISDLADGEHQLELSFEDMAGNISGSTLTLYRDVTAPAVSLLSPADGAAVNGTVEIRGSVEDIALESWQVTVTGEDGGERSLASGVDNADGELLAILNCADYADGETITIKLRARDKAGNESAVSGAVITVDKSAQPVAAAVSIETPENNSAVTSPTITGSYTADSSSSEQRGLYYIDGVYAGETTDAQFPFDAAKYAENSIHSLSVLSQRENGELLFCQGLADSVLLSETPESGTDEILSEPVYLTHEILSIRLDVTQRNGAATYFYSVNGGDWTEIAPDTDIPMLAHVDSIQLKAVLTGSATLYGWTLHGIVESSPTRVQVKLLRPVENIQFTDTTVTRAFTELCPAPEAAELHLYRDGEQCGDSFTYDARPVNDGEPHAVALLAKTADNTVWGTGAQAAILLREAPDYSAGEASARLESTAPLYALRLEAVYNGGTNFEYSTDGTNWLTLTPGEYAVLDRAAETVHVRARGGALSAWHIEGVNCMTSAVTADILHAPTNLMAAEYGAEYYANEKLRRYDLSWQDPNPADETAKNSTVYEIYRNGVLIGTAEGTQHTDENYIPKARYEVRVLRSYGEGFPQRRSAAAAAGPVPMKAPERLLGVSITPREEKQSEYLNSLYGGNYTFSMEEKLPEDEHRINKSLLGRNKLCAYGFEPVNFNTGNFLLETSDSQWESFSLDRVYNAQSGGADGAFGAKWASPLNEHLLLYTGGDILYTGADGAEIGFTLLPNGAYTGGESFDLRLSAEGDEYRVIDADGTTHAFTGAGLLKYIKNATGSRTEFERDDDGLLIAIVLPSGKRLEITTNEDGHITQIATLGESALEYKYQGANLVSFTDANGGVTRYEYDGQHRMTAWYDAEGKRQVRNTYDDENRVIRQTDANGGDYSLEYFDDHTVTTDAEGGISEVWFDELGRTLKTVDANGGETSYEYDARSSITAITDAAGLTTRYEYDEDGNKTKETAPDGSSVSMAYDENGNLTLLTDQLGNITSYEYDLNNNLIKQTNPDGGVQSWTYNADKLLTSATDALGNTTRYEYTGTLLTERTDANGSVTKYAYDDEERLTETIDALGNKTGFIYDAAGNLLEVCFADGSSFSYEYDAVGNLTAQTDALGNTTRYEYNAMRQLVCTVYPDSSETGNRYNANGKLVSTIDPNGGTISAEYDAVGNLTAVTDALGNVTGYEYDAAGRLIKTVYPNGGASVYSYDEAGQLTSETTPTGEVTRYGYDAAGHIISVTAPDGGVTESSYDANGRLASGTDANGNCISYGYDLNGNLISLTDALGNVTAFDYDACGNLLSITDALGDEISYEYDALGRTIRVTDANGAVTSYAYDCVGNLIRETDALGHATSYKYDANGSITELVDALGGRTAMDYDELGNATSVLQKNSGKVFAEYDAAGKLIKETDAMGGATTYEYNANGLVTKITDALEHSAEMRYDDSGNVIEITAPDGSSTKFNYDLSGRLISEIDANGTETRYAYDKAGRLSKTSVNGGESTYAYDAVGNIVSVTDAEGRSIALTYDSGNNLTTVNYPDLTQDSYEYDALGRMTRYTPRKGEPTSYTYNAMGDVLSITVGKQITHYEYDLLGRTTVIITPDGSRTETEYDALGNLTKVIDALGAETSYSYSVDGLLEAVTYANGAKVRAVYDLNSRIVAEIDPEGAQTRYEYDPVSRVTAVTDALGATTRYEYDAADRLTEVTDALSHETGYTYDLNGNLTSEIDALGNTTRYSYTPEGWLESVTDAEGRVTNFTYDATGNILTEDHAGKLHRENSYNEIGLLTTVTTDEGVTEYQYDDASRLVSVTQPNGETVSYTYDDYGNRATMTYPSGKTVKYSYDSMNRLVSVKGIDGTTTKYEYDALGRRTKTDGVKEDTTYVYDEMGNLVSQSITGAYDLAFDYTYDKSGRITRESRTENGATLTSDYEYDKLGQLTGFERSDGYTERYVYDSVGNMLTKTASGVKTKYTYNAGNQLVSDGENKYTYDKNGNLVQKGDTRYTYNALNLLESWTDGQTIETYSYNANGLLSRVTNDEGTTDLMWDVLMGDGVVISASTNGQETNYSHGLERISAQTDKTRTEYIYDGRGSVAAEVSYNSAWYTLGGALSEKDVVSKSYTPFGEQIGEAVSGFGYNGEYYNAVTGMIYLRARFYEPEMNRFSQKDILRGNILNTRSLNRYSYVQNDPVNYYDPSGEFGLLVGTAIAAGISGLIAGGVSAYQSYKATGKVDWKQAGKAALGGATAAVAVGVAVATGGAGFGLATMAIEAYAGVRTTMRGGDAAAVTTSMTNAGAAAVIARAVSPYIPPVVNLAIGSAGTAASGYKTVVDTRSAVSVFNNPRATTMDKLNAVTDVAEDVIGFYGSAKMAAESYRILFSSNDANYLCSRYQNSDDSDITDTPKVETDSIHDTVKNTDNNTHTPTPATGKTALEFNQQLNENILKGAIETTNKNGVARNFEKSGGFNKTLEDFNSLNLSNVKDIQTTYGLGKVGYLEDGTSVVARPGSKTGGPTLEIRISNTKIYKIRY